MKRVLSFAILIVTILIEGTGCMFDNKPKQDVNELALEYLEQKYGEKFEYYAPAGMSYTGTRRFLAKCETFGDERIAVQIDDYKSENRKFRDDYIARKYANQLFDYIEQTVKKQFDEAKVVSCWGTGNALSPALPADATFEEYMLEPEGRLVANIVVKKSDYKSREQLTQILETVVADNAAGTAEFIIMVIDDSKYEGCTIDEARNYYRLEDYYAMGELLRGNGDTSVNYYGKE